MVCIPGYILRRREVCQLHDYRGPYQDRHVVSGEPVRAISLEAGLGLTPAFLLGVSSVRTGSFSPWQTENHHPRIHPAPPIGTAN